MRRSVAQPAFYMWLFGALAVTDRRRDRRARDDVAGRRPADSRDWRPPRAGRSARPGRESVSANRRPPGRHRSLARHRRRGSHDALDGEPPARSQAMGSGGLSPRAGVVTMRRSAPSSCPRSAREGWIRRCCSEHSSPSSGRRQLRRISLTYDRLRSYSPANGPPQTNGCGARDPARAVGTRPVDRPGSARPDGCRPVCRLHDHLEGHADHDRERPHGP